MELIVLGYISAILVGLTLGLLGGGGSILTVPILVYLFRIPASVATVYSLFVVGITSLVGTLGYLRLRLVHFRVGASFLFPSLVGVWVARQVILPSVPEQIVDATAFTLTKDRLILLVFAAVMGLASYSMLRSRKANAAPKNSEPSHAQIAVYGLFAGTLMGFVGAGGGFLIIPVLVTLGKMEMKHAVGTSLFIITASSLFGFAGDILNQAPIDWTILFAFSSLSVVGVFIGTSLSKRVPSYQLKRAFGWMVLGISVLMLLKEIFFQ